MSRVLGGALLLGGASSLAACGALDVQEEAAPLAGQAELALELDPQLDAQSAGDQAAPADDYTLFEADPVRPVAVLRKTGLVVVTNTFDDAIDVLEPVRGGVRHCGAVKVGMRPVAVAAVRELGQQAELWVVNHLSDSISVVMLDTDSCRGEVVDTLYTGDEPRDIVLAADRAGKPRVFVTAAHRGQHHPLEGARLAGDLVASPRDKATSPGLADVLVFDPRHRTARPSVVNLFTDTPRALALGDGVVYAAGFRTGNRTTAVHAERVAQRGIDSLSALLARDANGAFIERNGELVLGRGVRGQAKIEGGMPAVAGSGRCMPDPRFELRERFLQQVCVATDREHRVQRVVLEQEGEVNASCQCTSGDGTLQPTTSVIVKFFDSKAVCGSAYEVFADRSRGCWLDAEPKGVRTPAARAGEQGPAMAWNDDVKLSLPDTDVFAISVDNLRVTQAFSGVGTVLFSMAVQPRTGRVFVTNTDAQNLTRFEGEGQSASTTVLGHLHESRVTLIDPGSGRVQPVHLNSQIDYSRCCERREIENANSFAFPTSGVFSPDGEDYYFSALGSDSIGVAKAAVLKPGFDNLASRRSQRLRSIAVGTGSGKAVGPVGLELDPSRHRLYVKTHFSNELLVIDSERNSVIGRVSLHNPEPASIRDGREVFYDARTTSAHGDSACASCHVFGDLDGVSWDLGNPDGASVNNPGPYVLPPELAALAEIASDPFATAPVARSREPDFRTNKGPMNTQTLRGMANHGATHWRGDRTRNFQAEVGRQPSFGSLDENNSFNEFDVAITGLNGNDRSLEPAVFQAFTDFALQLTLPPNPIRALDNSLSVGQSRARALYFGCRSMTDAQFEARQCIAEDGALVDIDPETQSCTCANNPLVVLLHDLPQAQGFARLLQAVLSDPEQSSALDAVAADAAGLPPARALQVAEAFARYRSSREALLAADFSLGDKGLLPLDPALALSGTLGAWLDLLQISSANGTPTGAALLSELAGAFSGAALPAGSTLGTASGVQSALASSFALANLDLGAVADESARGSGEFHDVLQGCDPSATPAVCRLRVTDSFETCNGCHTLDPRGNAQFDVYRPGFFGTSGEYSFENVSQIFKVPHLRNQYQKVGMFGMPFVEFVLPESVLGALSGGFFAAENEFTGPQVRGFGFMHDGALDTLHRFHGAAVFAARSRGTINASDPGNVDGLDPVLPEESERGACVERFRAAPAQALGAVEDPALREALGLCLSGSPVPDACFLDPSTELCEQTLDALGGALGQADFRTTFSASIRPACFQLGSMLEQGSVAGHCAPRGLRERADMESFMLAFDSNLKPMVGQQLTLHDDGLDEPLLAPMLAAAEAGQCDIALRQKNRGYLVTRPNAQRAARSQLSSSNGRSTTLGALRAADGAITLTCYPPLPHQAEARRSAFGASQGW